MHHLLTFDLIFKIKNSTVADLHQDVEKTRYHLISYPLRACTQIHDNGVFGRATVADYLLSPAPLPDDFGTLLTNSHQPFALCTKGECLLLPFPAFDIYG